MKRPVSVALEAILKPNGPKDVVQAICRAERKHVASFSDSNDVVVDLKVDASTETRCKVVSLGLDYAKVEVVFRFEVDETGAG